MSADVNELAPTPWQPNPDGMRPCDRHHGQCAYQAGDPDRCDVCHATWDVIASWGYGDRTEHETDHAKAAKYLKIGAAKPHLSEAQTDQRRALRRTQRHEQPSGVSPVSAA